jgi:hypothetical protein
LSKIPCSNRLYDNINFDLWPEMHAGQTQIPGGLFKGVHGRRKDGCM